MTACANCQHHEGAEGRDWPHPTLALVASITNAEADGGLTTETRYQCWECETRWRRLHRSGAWRGTWQRLDELQSDFGTAGAMPFLAPSTSATHGTLGSNS